MKLWQEELITIRRELHQIPEIGLKEFQTQKYLLQKIEAILPAFGEVRTWQTGIMVKLNGSNPTKMIGWRADIDGLPILEEVASEFQSGHEGYMHACGHDFHMTIGLGLLQRMCWEQPTQDLLFLFQPAEENEAGGMLMYEDGAFDEWHPDEFYALHVNPELPVGVISTRVGTLFAGTCEVSVNLTGKSGHAAYPQRANDMVIAGVNFIQQVQTIVSRNVNPVEGAVVTFGSFHAGKTNNVIAGEAYLFGTIRTLTQEMNLFTRKRIKEIGAGIAQSFDCKVDMELIQKGYLPVVNNEKTTETFIEFMKNDPEVDFVRAQAAMTGEDFGYILSKIPGTMFWLGVNSPYGLHSPMFEPDETAIPFAVKAIGDFLLMLTK